ncbi:MAG: xanthine dehydrogenase small subunit [Bacteroidales bacterium]|nr:xanthine dehydrogenase small subunit [Bacteroidales bacterium]HQP04459.1 xanthine dehydrogenase small subunit [Bacteroidales bacterium]
MNSVIKFVFKNKTVEIDFEKNQCFNPSITLLDYLRLTGNSKGVKEGCAEGDCGACTVVIAETDKNGRLHYKAVDSCLMFLPMIHGKQLICVEDLVLAENGRQQLHPVQQCMVESDATQCGYCTPGFVMSVFALFKNNNNPTEQEIVNALSGNLCRCTGYQPIIDAAKKACVYNGIDHFSDDEKKVVALLNEILIDTTTIELKNTSQLYFKPLLLHEALRLRNEFPLATIVNGSTDIALRQTKKKELIRQIIDISDVSELNGFYEDDNQYIFGAGTTIETVLKQSSGKIPALETMLAQFGSLQIRNIATIGGNLSSASPIGDTTPVLFVLGAHVRLKSIISDRQIPVEDFITGYRKTVMDFGEILTEIMIPKYDASYLTASYKVSKRKSLDISTLSAAFLVKLQDGNVEEIRIAFGGMAAVTSFAVKTQSFLNSREWNRKYIEQAIQILSEEFTPISDARADANYRKNVAANLLLKFFISTPYGAK